jgi:hypothetical protein
MRAYYSVTSKSVPGGLQVASIMWTINTDRLKQTENIISMQTKPFFFISPEILELDVLE